MKIAEIRWLKNVKVQLLLTFCALLTALGIAVVRNQDIGVYGDGHFFRKTEEGYVYRAYRIVKEKDAYQIFHKEEVYQAIAGEDAESTLISPQAEEKMEESLKEAVWNLENGGVRKRSNSVPLWIFSFMFLIGAFHFYLPYLVAYRFKQDEAQMIASTQGLRRAGLISMIVSLVMMVYTHV